MKAKTIEFIEENKIIAICRGIYGESLVNLVTALYEGGIRLVEVTFDQGDKDCLKKTSEAIKLLTSSFDGMVKIGAGTVVTAEQVHEATNAGAEYIIAPNVNKEVIQEANKLNMVTIPGAMTPTEILDAHFAGADFVKLFPAGTLGLNYAKDILGPINNVKLIATAGVTPDNLEAFLKLGFSGAGISSYLTNKTLVNEGKFDILREHAEELVSIVSKI